MSRHDFAALCLPHRDNLVSFAQRFTGRRDLAEDLVQDAFVSALNRWDEFCPSSDDPEVAAACAKAWMFKNVRNKYFDEWRRSRRRQRWLENRHHDVLDGVYGDQDERSLALRSAPTAAPELGDEVGAALAELDPAGREVVERIDLRGEQYASVAEDLGVPIGTVMSRLYRARRRLAVALAHYARSEYRITRNRDERLVDADERAAG